MFLGQELLVLSLFLLSIVAATQSSDSLHEIRRFFLDVDLCKICFDCTCHTTRCKDYVHKCSHSYHGTQWHCSADAHTNGGWSQWSSHGSCVGDPGSEGQQTQTRSCNHPAQVNCGRPCDGESRRHIPCTVPGATHLTDALLMTIPTPTTTTPQPTTTTPQPTTTTPQPTTTTPRPTSQLKQISCEKLCTVASVATETNRHNAAAPHCSNGGQTSTEALLLECCDMSPKRDAWKPVGNVMQMCGRTGQYIPVGRFVNGLYEIGSGGIFISCSDDNTTGFLMALQSCVSIPTLEHVTNNGTTLLDHPESYFFIEELNTMAT